MLNSQHRNEPAHDLDWDLVASAIERMDARQMRASHAALSRILLGLLTMHAVPGEDGGHARTPDVQGPAFRGEPPAIRDDQLEWLLAAPCRALETSFANLEIY